METPERPIVTVQQHILQEQQRFAEASGEFSWLLSGITLATKMIQARVRRAGLTDILGSAEQINIQGEEQQKLDVYANNVLLHCLGVRDSVAALASEEAEQPLLLRENSATARYVVLFDPLDGSSNIDTAASVGTIFSILRRPHLNTDGDLLVPGTEQVAAGYVIYGSSTVLVYSAGNGVHGFTLDPAVGAYVLSHENIRIPPQGGYYSVNASHNHAFPPRYQTYLEQLRSGGLGRDYSLRYIGSFVGDFHRTLLKGGVFLYPPTQSNPAGKLRLMYEASPMAFLAEQAGGRATDGTRRILEIDPTDVHQRTPLVIGSPREVEAFEALT